MIMELQDFLEYLNSGKTVIAGSAEHQFMCELSQEALRLTAQINNVYHTPEELREIWLFVFTRNRTLSP